MRKLTTAAVTLALALASGAAFADDSSMSRWTGESYKAFEADKMNRNVAVGMGELNKLNASPDNGMSRWNGDSYVAFEQARTSPAPVTISIAEANKARTAVNHEVTARTATRGRTSVNPFRNDTAA
jgi:hypothetical protein